MSARINGVRQWQPGARLLRMVSHPVRLRILDVLRGGAMSVSEVNQTVNVIQPNLSQHLAVLREAQLVASHVDGPRRCYYLLRPDLVDSLLGMLTADHPITTRAREEVVAEVISHR